MKRNLSALFNGIYFTDANKWLIIRCANIVQAWQKTITDVLSTEHTCRTCLLWLIMVFVFLMTLKPQCQRPQTHQNKNKAKNKSVLIYKALYWFCDVWPTDEFLPRPHLADEIVPERLLASGAGTWSLLPASGWYRLPSACWPPLHHCQQC